MTALDGCQSRRIDRSIFFAEKNARTCGSNPTSATKQSKAPSERAVLLFFASFSAHFSEGGKCDDFTHLFIVLL